jgi:hypothetical protein
MPINDPAAAQRAELAARLAAAIEECAKAATGQECGSDRDVTARLAAVWAILTGADPELATRTRRYTEP